ncbi:hypothetical protein OS242_13160 [Tumebacillus sp. DT12]|uniref:Uncharacterized protein n=1 Tax=Tumebacillus lacus TaxID=2995335 RepID=A0ABT3X4J7_9BACL|nr:hypothetical protein [Tumebacillus lacus]MCX7570893.1 hypothetical protein [Tumebacillus lacus]
MTNEQLLLQIGRMMGETVREAVQESEQRMRVYVQEVVQTSIQESEQRMKEYVQETVQASEQRMKGYVQEVVQASEHRMKKYVQETVQASEQRLTRKIVEVDERLSAGMDELQASSQRSLDETEEMALQIAATFERIERIECVL